MVNRIISLVLSMALTTPVWACEQNVKYLEKGQEAPCNGYLFSPKKELELRLLDTQYKYTLEELKLKDNQILLYKQKSEYSFRQIRLEQEKSELWRDLAEKNTLTLVSLQEDRGKRDWLFFVGGILATVGAGWAIGQAAK